MFITKEYSEPPDVRYPLPVSYRDRLYNTAVLDNVSSSAVAAGEFEVAKLCASAITAGLPNGERPQIDTHICVRSCFYVRQTKIVR